MNNLLLMNYQFYSHVSVFFCVCLVPEFHPPESVSLLLCHWASPGPIDRRREVTELSNSFIDWLFPFSLHLPLSSSSPAPRQVGRRVLRRSSIAAGRPASASRCHGDATASGTARTERTRSSAPQVSSRRERKTPPASDSDFNFEVPSKMFFPAFEIRACFV